jgi:hypothetical protein
MPIFCDESGGVGRGVMTLAAVDMDSESADALLARFRTVTGYLGELKGSRIDLAERALLFELLVDSGAQATVGIAISALVTQPDTDRGTHDAKIYAALLDDVVSAILPDGPTCESVIIDDGRYDPDMLGKIRADIAKLVGPCGTTQLELSHRLAGLQIADVIANSFFNRAMGNERQRYFAAIVAPLLESGQIKLRVLPGNTQGDDQHRE